MSVYCQVVQRLEIAYTDVHVSSYWYYTWLTNWPGVLRSNLRSDLRAVTVGNELCKYADDTYIIITAVNADSITNNLKLNLAKSQQIIFVDKRRKTSLSAQAVNPELQLVQMINFMGVTLTNGISVSPHVQSFFNIVCSKIIRIASLANSWLIWQCRTNNFQSGRGSQTDIRIKR